MGLLSNNMQGALFMMCAMTAFTVNDACIKALGAEIPLFQLLVIRSIAALGFLVVVAWRSGALRVRIARRDQKLIAIRSLCEMAAAYFFLTALLHMPFASISAILQALPLTVTLGAAILLRESVGWRRFVAIGIGFVGVYLIIRPGPGGFNVYALFGVIAVLAATARDLASRRLSSGVPSLTVAVATATGVMLFSLVGGAFVKWQPMTLTEIALMAGSVIGIAVAYLCSVMAMRVGEIGFVAPFRYSSLIVAMIFGLIFFGEWPDQLTLIGAAIVVATGLFTLWREQQAIRNRDSAKTPA